MGYWGDIAARGWREAREQVRWDTPLRLALAFGPSAASFLATYAVTHEVAVGVAAAILALSVIAFGTFLSKFVTLPPKLAALGEADRRRLAKALASYDDPDDDADLRAGIAYVEFREWGHPFWEADGDHLSALGRHLDDIQRRANRSRIHIWGRGNPTSLHVPIPPDFWEFIGVDLLSVTMGDEEPVATQKNGQHHYRDLRINRAEFEREWPPIGRP